MNKVYTSSHLEILSQDMECYTDDQDTFQTAYIYHKKNPNEFSDPSVGMDIDRNVSSTKKRERHDMKTRMIVTNYSFCTFIWSKVLDGPTVTLVMVVLLVYHCIYVFCYECN